MGHWELNADTLAESRFRISPLAETLAGLKLLHRPAPAHPGERAWLDAHLPAFRARLRNAPVAAALLDAGFAPSWNAEFLTPVPGVERDGGRLATFDAELAAVADTPPQRAREDLEYTLGRPLAARLARDDLPQHAAELLDWVWRHTVRPSWPRRSRVLAADIAARTDRLARDGWSAALEEIKPGVHWLGANRLHLAATGPDRLLTSARLHFVPVTVATGWFCWRAERYAVVYPCAGALADPNPPRPHRALARLLGPGRATALTLLASPKNTTQLVALTGQALGSVGRHLRVLHDAGLISRARAGRSVLYTRTAAGDALIDAVREDSLPHDG